MVQIHLPEGSNGKTSKLSHLIMWGFALLMFSVTAFVIITAIHEIKHW
jgi:hypothetical protein